MIEAEVGWSMMRDEGRMESGSKESEIDWSKISRSRFLKITGTKKMSEECSNEQPPTVF